MRGEEGEKASIDGDQIKTFYTNYKFLHLCYVCWQSIQVLYAGWK